MTTETAMINTFEFGKNERVKEIPFELLAQSTSLLEDCDKPPRSRPIDHHKLIQGVGDILSSNDLDFIQEPIWVSHSGSHYLTSKDIQLAENHIRRRIFERVVTTLKINTLADDTTSGAIAIGYNERGIQIAWGTNVNACSNMSIFGKWFMSTYGGEKMPSMDKMFEVLNNWAANFAAKREYDKYILNEMKNISVCERDITDIIGELHLNAVNFAYLDKRNKAALNIAQVSSFTRKYLEMEDKPETLYDVYNLGTNILKPKTSDLSVVWESNALFGAFIVSMFNIGTPASYQPELTSYEELLDN